MSKIIFSNGCSFLTARPKDGVETFTAEILSKTYDSVLHNIAMGGRGNDRISFTTKLWFEQNNMKDTFAIIGWSSSYRQDYISNDGWKKGRIPNMDLTWRTWKIEEQLRFIQSNIGYDIENNSYRQFLDNVIDLQNYFNYKKIPYIMYNSLPQVINNNIKDFKTMFDYIDKKRFFKIESSHLEFIQKNNFIVSPNDPHPNTQGHQEWATQLKGFIDANNLRTI
jgi:hypothetical protein